MREELNRIESLGEHGDLHELVDWLAHDDWQVRRAAVEALVARALGPEQGARDAAVSRLIDALYSEENAGLRNAAQEVLTRIAPYAAARMVRAVEGAPTDVQILLAPVLGDTGNPAVVPTLLRLVASDDVNIATAAIIGLGRLRRRDAVRPLLDILAGDDLWLLFPAVEALGVLGDTSAVAPLAARLGDSLLGPSALEALTRIGDAEAARAIAARLFAGEPLDAALLDALVRIAENDWPGELADAVRASVVRAFREQYRPERFDELVELTKAGEARAEAADEALGWSGDPRALPVLLVALGRPVSQASAAAGLAALFEDPATVADLANYTEHLSASVRLEVARVLAASAPDEAALLLADLLADDQEDVWREAIEVAADASSRLGGAEPGAAPRAAEAVERLLAAVERAEPEARVAVARLVVSLAGAGALDVAPLAERAARLAESADLDVRLACAALLGAWGGLSDRARETLDEALHDGDPFVRLRAVEVAAESGDAELRGLFSKALADEEPLVRRAAVAALAGFDDEDATRALRSAVNDWHGLVAADALSALAARSDAVGETSLLAASRSDRALLRCVAAGRLAALGTEQADARVLEMALSDPEFEVRRAAVAAFRGRPGDGARQAADVALGDPHHSVRHAGLRLASEFPDPDLAVQLAAIADTDESEDVRGEALVALAGCDTAAALDRAGRAMLEPALAPYAVRAFRVVAGREPARLRRYRDEEAPPRAAFAIDTLYAGTSV